MKKHIHILFVVLSSIIFVSCGAGMLKPGDKIGDMRVEKHSMSTKYPDVYDFCTYQPEETRPGIQTTDCDVPLISKMQIDFGWSAKDATMLDANWNLMTWEIYIDGHQVDLNEFGQWNDRGRPDLGVNTYARGWILDLNNISPGKHTLRYLWKSDNSINDGFEIYAPGTYEHIVNFTVLEK